MWCLKHIMDNIDQEEAPSKICCDYLFIRKMTADEANKLVVAEVVSSYSVFGPSISYFSVGQLQ